VDTPNAYAGQPYNEPALDGPWTPGEKAAIKAIALSIYARTVMPSSETNVVHYQIAERSITCGKIFARMLSTYPDLAEGDVTRPPLSATKPPTARQPGRPNQPKR
jgi:hypothetical protein